MPPLTVDTLGLWKSEGYSVSAHCGECQHSVQLDLDALIDRLGPDFLSVGSPNPLATKLRCKRCGSKAIQLGISPPTDPHESR